MSFTVSPGVTVREVDKDIIIWDDLEVIDFSGDPRYRKMYDELLPVCVLDGRAELNAVISLEHDFIWDAVESVAKGT